jgi:hypothetical protein
LRNDFQREYPFDDSLAFKTAFTIVEDSQIKTPALEERQGPANPSSTSAAGPSAYRFVFGIAEHEGQDKNARISTRGQRANQWFAQRKVKDSCDTDYKEEIAGPEQPSPDRPLFRRLGGASQSDPCPSHGYQKNEGRNNQSYDDASHVHGFPLIQGALIELRLHGSPSRLWRPFDSLAGGRGPHDIRVGIYLVVNLFSAGSIKGDFRKKHSDLRIRG